MLSLIDDCFSIGRQSASRKRMEQVRIPIGGSFKHFCNCFGMIHPLVMMRNRRIGHGFQA